jgi:MFS family permease
MTRSEVPPTVKGLGLVSFFNDLASEMVYPLLPAFVTRVLGGGAVALGALDGAADLTAAALKWVSGRLSDRKGWQKPLIIAGYGTAVLVRPLIAVANAAWQVIGFRVLDRIGKGLRSPARDALVAQVTSPEARGAGLHITVLKHDVSAHLR